MNELIFAFHILLLLGFIFIASRVGKHALMTLITLQVVLANLFVTKEIILFGLHVTPTDAYAVGSLIGLGLLQEYFGKEEAKKMIALNFLILLFFTAMAAVQTFYVPSAFDKLDSAFSAVLSVTPRIFLSSLVCFYLTQKLDIELFQWLRKRLSLTYAMAISLLITQAFDTAAFSLLALWGLVHSLAHNILKVSLL